ncbi:DNA topoisomerase VI subunit B, partial [[Eubacterium] cellulosolvens]
YLKQTAIVAPYSNVIFVDPRGRLYKFNRVTSKMPTPPQETKPHPHGVDVETIKRLITITSTRTVKEFIKDHFQRVGEATAKTFLEYVGVDPKKDPKKMLPEEIVKIVKAMMVYNGFLPPQADCLSPIGEELLETGIRKVLNPEFIAVVQRPAAAYSGFPFIIEVGIAYGGDIPVNNKVTLYRFANKIPLLFDEASDVSWKVVNNLIDWRRYKVSSEAPLAVFIHLCSTKIPYKTVGKEFIADRPEVEREILNATREAARRLSLFLSKRQTLERQKKRLDVFAKYLPKIAQFSTILSEKVKEPDIKALLEGVMRYDDLDAN